MGKKKKTAKKMQEISDMVDNILKKNDAMLKELIESEYEKTKTMNDTAEYMGYVYDNIIQNQYRLVFYLCLNNKINVAAGEELIPCMALQQGAVGRAADILNDYCDLLDNVGINGRGIKIKDVMSKED